MRFHAHAHPFQVALREIRMYQKTVEHLIPHAPFLRFVKEIAYNVSSGDMKDSLRFKPEALDALQEAAEAFLVGFQKCQRCRVHATVLHVYVLPWYCRITCNSRGPDCITVPAMAGGWVWAGPG